MSKPTSVCRTTERKHPWPMVRLGDVCEVRAGANYKDVEDPNGRYPIYGTGGIMGRASQYRCPAHSIIVGRKGTLDNPFLVHEPFWNIDTCFGVVPSEKIIPEYLFRFCQGFDFYSLVPASGRPSTTSDAVRSIEIPLPSLSEQKEIVARLERELAAVEKIKKGFETLAETAKAGFKAELKEVFEEISRGGAYPPAEGCPRSGCPIRGETRRLGEVCETISTRGHQIKQLEIRDRGKYPVVSQSENDIEGWTDEDIAIYEVPLVLFGDHTCVVKKIERPFVVGADGTKLLKVKECGNSYLFYFVKYVAASLLDGEYRRHYSDLVEKEIPLPPLSIQREVVARLDSAKARAEKLEAKAREGMAVCETMRKAILKEVFE